MRDRPTPRRLRSRRTDSSSKFWGADDRAINHAEGDLKLGKLGSFNSARFFHIRAGDSSSNLDDVDDEYVSIYALDSETPERWPAVSTSSGTKSQTSTCTIA